MFRSWLRGLGSPLFYDSGGFPGLVVVFPETAWHGQASPREQASCRILHTCPGGGFGPSPPARRPRRGRKLPPLGKVRLRYRNRRERCGRNGPKTRVAPGMAAPARGVGRADAGLGRDACCGRLRYRRGDGVNIPQSASTGRFREFQQRSFHAQPSSQRPIGIGRIMRGPIRSHHGPPLRASRVLPQNPQEGMAKYPLQPLPWSGTCGMCFGSSACRP